MASAARLAKLGHAVELVEATDQLGGAMTAVASGGFCWGPSTTLLPAVLRDLFRKTGRPLEREVELVPLEVIRKHHFPDGSTVQLPGGSRAAQLRAVEKLGTGLGERWLRHVDELGDDWELVRRDYLERPWDATSGPPTLRRRLATRRSVHARLRELGDPRLRALAAQPLVGAGQDPRRVPAWMAIWPYVEQRFGGWRVLGGLPTLADALAARLKTRRVDVHLSTAATDIVVRDGRVAAVATSAGLLDADVVVCAVDPGRLPALASYVTRTRPVDPAHLVHLGLAEASELAEAATGVTVWHGDPMVSLRQGLAAPSGQAAVTIELRGGDVADPLALLAERGLELRDRVLTRIEVTPAEQSERWSGSPWGVRWQGRGTVRHRLGPRTPIAGVYCAGAHATPGAGIPLVGLSAALVAHVVGPAG